jgi:NAD(P)-dependent dehydrogenase (short-subunit alcohol dehydrogenase family)
VAEFGGKVALVTGGSSGIGKAAAALLAERGASVLLGGLDPGEVDQAVAEVRSTSGSAAVFGKQVDVTDEDSVRALVEHAVDAHGGLDVLITAAGVQRYGTAASTTAAEWNEVLRVNLTGCFLTVHHALPHLRRRGGGSIVIVSSVQAYVTQAEVAGYTASKAALNAFARSVAIDEAQHGIRANTVCPGSVDTPMLRWAARRFSDGTAAGEAALVAEWGRMHPMGRVARPGEVAEAIAFLGSARSSFITGVGLPVDGGLLAAAGVVLSK